MCLRLLLLLLFFPYISHAQSELFEWAVGGSNADMPYEFQAVDVRNNIIAGGHMPFNNLTSDAAVLHDAYGEDFPLFGGLFRDGTDVIVSYSPRGKINWVKEYPGQSARLEGVAADRKGNVFLLQTIKQRHIDENEKEWGYLPLFKGQPAVEPGLYLICLNLEGEPQWYERIISVCSECIEITGFVLHPHGGFVVTAAKAFGGLYSVPEIDFGQTGGFMIARISERGKLNWAKVAKLATSAYSKGPIVQLGIHPSGTVYVTGIYQKAMAFSEDEKTPGYPLSGGYDRNALPLKSFLAAYSAEGTLKWVRYSGENYATSAIYATKKLIYLASTNGPKPFGLEADTTNQKKCALLAFKHSGKPAWIKTFPLKKIDAIIASPNEKNLFLAGQTGDNKLIRLGNDTLKGRIFVAGFSPKGKYKWSGSAKFWTNKRVNLIVDQNHNLYVSGYFDTGIYRALSTWDPAFIAGYTQGGTPFLGLIKIPSKHR